MAGKAVLEAAGHSVRVFVRSMHAFGYPAGEQWDEDEILEAYDRADVVIIHNDAMLLDRLPPLPDKPLIVHHHGSQFRRRPGETYRAAADIGAVQIVSTVDLLLSVPEVGEAFWFPQVIDADKMALIREWHQDRSSRIRVSHAPTNRHIKGSSHVIRAMRHLKYEAEFILIQRQPWSVCLSLKASSDIFVDQLILGYGNNAIEAWAMGLPVLASASPWILERMQEEFGQMPFFTTSASYIQRDLQSFIHDSELREEWATAGKAHVQRFHAPDAWLANAERLYRDVIARSAIPTLTAA